MPYVYRYIDRENNEVKYIGIIALESNFPRRFKQHEGDEWYKNGNWLIEYIKVDSRTDAEALEGHFIWFYKTGRYFNKAKVNWGPCSFTPNPYEYEWIEYVGCVTRKKEYKKRVRKHGKEKYDTTRRLLFGKGKAEVARATGITVRTQQNWESDPTTMKAQGMAKLIKARELDPDEIMLVLKDLSL